MTNSISVRGADEADSKSIWEWRNDPHTRKNSVEQNEVSWESHCQWYAQSLEAENRRIFVGIDEDTDTAIGMVRFDINATEFTAATSINLNPDWRGKGISAQLLRLAIGEIQREQTLVLTAEIKPDNTPSIKCFERCGFALYETSTERLVFKNKQGIIDAIEQVRSANNVNWMDLMRLAFRKAPKEAEAIVGRINGDDGKISELLKRLGD